MIQKLQIVTKLFPIIPEHFVRFILNTCGGEISKTIDFILSKNLNDPCKAMPIFPHAMFSTGLYGSPPTSGIFGNTTAVCRFPAFQPMSSALETLRFPWSVYSRFPACSFPIRFHTEGKSIATIPDSSVDETKTVESEGLEPAN